jgi:aminopeptidase N
VLKLNSEGSGNYRVQYDQSSWKSLIELLPKLSVPDRTNLLGDAWALVQAGRVSAGAYLSLIDKLPSPIELAEQDQIINTFDYINRLLIGEAARENFRTYARRILRLSFDQLGWNQRPAETPRQAILRGNLIQALGDLDDAEIISGCRDRFQKYVIDPASIPPDLRASMLWVVGHYADQSTWDALHEFGLRSTNIEEKQDYYDALAAARDPELVTKTLRISLSDELPTSRAVFLVGKVARYSDHPDLAWEFAKAHMKALLAKTDALGATSYAPSLFVFFSDASRASELKAYAKTNLPGTTASAKEVAKAVGEVEFRSEFKRRLITQLAAWADHGAKLN